MYSIKVKTQGAARDIHDQTITALAAQMNAARGLQKGDMVAITNSAARMLALATGRAAGPDAAVAVDFMMSRTKEGRKFTWTCQIEVVPARMDGDPGQAIDGTDGTAAEPPTG